MRQSFDSALDSRGPVFNDFAEEKRRKAAERFIKSSTRDNRKHGGIQTDVSHMEKDPRGLLRDWTHDRSPDQSLRVRVSRSTRILEQIKSQIQGVEIEGARKGEEKARRQ